MVNSEVFNMLALTFTNFTSFPPCSAPGAGPRLWWRVRPGPLTLANVGPSAGAPLGFDWLQTPRHPVMTSEHLTTRPPPSLSPSVISKNGNQHATLPPPDEKCL